jgi:hypothetical protein
VQPTNLQISRIDWQRALVLGLAANCLAALAGLYFF